MGWLWKASSCGWSGHFHGGRWGNGIIASSFFRALERNVRQFCGRWFSQVWAWILLGYSCLQPRSTELLGAVSELCSREFFAGAVATSTEAAPGNGIIASSFFRAQNATLGTFAGIGFRRFGLESCWGSAVSQPCSTEPQAATSKGLWHVLLTFRC